MLRATLVVVLMMAIGCGPSDEQVAAERRVRELTAELEEARAQRASLEERLAALSEQNSAMANRLRALGQNVEELEGERGRLQTDLSETQRALEELRARERQAQARLATFRQMLQRFQSMIASGQLRVRILRGRMVVELPEGVLFDSGEATLKREGEATLTQVAQILAQIPDRNFQVAGHTDNVPIRSRRFPSNWELSTTRAVNVSRFLIAQQVPSARLSAAGYAETQPADANARSLDEANDTPEERAQNRRIEIVLMPNLDELPDLSTLESATGAGAAAPAPAPAQ
jgi:chemotaxis protein MotB